MGKIETATQWMINLANDNSHGYDQTYRWGERGDYDCSSSVITAWQTAGVPVKTNGATYTGNMRSVFLNCGFSDVTSSIVLSNGSGLQRGDVLLNVSSHTVMFIGSGQVVAARENENGTATGGKPGDQTGKEICIENYYNYPWDYVLRYNEGSSNPNPPSGNSNVQAGQVQANNFAGCNIDTDGVRGTETKKAGIKVLQHAM
ncbi:peptidoglycan amidohydrolase family protein, partial [Clostridium sp. BL-8]|uniref:peptidoglycan amidohydrolase family protein n=1 Tax=Clostridium sp. BL-8 TaxID=349938 RepID=UPI00098CDFD1